MSILSCIGFNYLHFDEYGGKNVFGRFYVNICIDTLYKRIRYAFIIRGMDDLMTF